jgi:uncharacterized damage-inducible protein DinB
VTPSITLEELLGWSRESAAFWREHLEANPALLELPCGIGGAANVLAFVRHIWGVELRWSQRIAAVPETPREEIPEGPVGALFGLHEQAAGIWLRLLGDPAQKWDETVTMAYDWLPPHARTASRRKLMAHALFHGQRHYAQLSTLVRAAGFPSGFRGDILFSLALP